MDSHQIGKELNRNFRHKNTIIKMKNSVDGLSSNMVQPKKVLVNWTIVSKEL